uniref:V-type proton ATPase subunit a n=1 Tax=Acrobeloides nanus TaxID=290746 RepID=A0A914BXQ8_9BILA
MFPYGVSLSELEAAETDSIDNENWPTAMASPIERLFTCGDQETPLVEEPAAQQPRTVGLSLWFSEIIYRILTAIFSIPELLHRTYITFNRTFSQRDFNVSEAEIARDDCNISNPLFEDNNFIRAHANGNRENEREPLSNKVSHYSTFQSKPIMSFRSEPLKLCQLIVPKDSAYDCVVELGKKSVVHFKDLNKNVNVFQRTYVREVKRCSELERCIRYIENQVIEGGAKKFIPEMDTSNIEISLQREIYDLEIRLFDLERDIRILLDNETALRRNCNDLMEFQEVLQKVESFFDIHIEDKARNQLDVDRSQYNDFGTPLTPLIDHDATPWFVAGTIDTSKRVPFERVLWRACRRTAFVKTAEIYQEFKDPETRKPVEKSVFIVFFKGQKLKDIVDRVCEGFKAKQYPCPKSSRERMLVLADLEIRIHDMNIVLDTTKTHKHELLSNAAVGLPEWNRQVHLQMAIYHALNNFTFDTSGNFFVAECWVPEIEIDDVMQALQRGANKSGATVHPILNVMETEEIPPTYNRTNKFTQIFQDIVNSYGVASYREMNPAPFTIISFPFLFSIMFGDFGHGLIMFLAGLYLVLNEKKLSKVRNEIFSMFFSGRYIILLMGLFSIYAGVIYNDAFAKSFNVFGSAWTKDMYTKSSGAYNNSQSYIEFTNMLSKGPHESELSPSLFYNHDHGPYAFGIDPIWNLAENRLSFVNSMKMKLSVIIGIAQMAFGLFLSLLNHRFFHSNIDIYSVFIPQILFLTCIFVYLCLQIIVKWIFFSVFPGTIFGRYYPGAHCAPSLLIGLISMFMFKKREAGFVDMTNENRPALEGCHLNQWYPGQSTVEMVLVIVALLAVPVMLFGKPVYVLVQRFRRRGRKQLGHEEGFGDIIMHQAIHTIEFVLGCVSHTASYLRLWALSLAHSQLSEVLWDMVLSSGGLATESYFKSAICLPLIFFLYALGTLSVLVIMEGLSAFLHTLRLHWVEFQSKFYIGEGYLFVPFSLKQSLEKIREGSDYY